MPAGLPRPDSEPSTAGGRLGSGEWAPGGGSEEGRAVPPYFGATAAGFSALPAGLDQNGSTSASHEKPPPYEPPVTTTRLGSTCQAGSSARYPASSCMSFIS